MERKTYPTIVPSRPWYTQAEQERLSKGVNIRLHPNEFDELKELLNREEQSMTNAGRKLLRGLLKRLRKKYKVEE